MNNMKHLEEFKIPLTGSKESVSEFSFELKMDFFDAFEDKEIIASDVRATMTMTKGIDVYNMSFHIEGDVEINCDRCLDPMVQNIEHEAILIVKVADKYKEVDDTVVTIGPKDDDINVASFVYEYAKLALPLQRVHFDEDDCNSEMLDQMHKYERREESEEEKEVDSRWNALADLKSKMK